MQELLAIQQQGPRAIGFFGTRNMGYMHQQLIEILSYAMVITVCSLFMCHCYSYDLPGSFEISIHMSLSPLALLVIFVYIAEKSYIHIWGFRN